MSSPAPLRRSRKLLYSFVVLVASMLAAESLARLVLPREPSPIVWSANPRLIYELDPSYPGHNSVGMRQPAVDPSRLHDRIVIAVIGDSHSYGSGAFNPAYTFPARLEHHLNAHVGRDAFTVLNLGVIGYNMVQELEVLRAKALAFHPDLIILQYCINDDHIPNFIHPRYLSLNRAIHKSVLLTSTWTTFLYSDFGNDHVLPYLDRVQDFLLFTPGLVGTPVSRELGGHGPTHPTRSADLVPARYLEFIGRDNLERAVGTFGEVCRQHRIPTLATGFIEDGDRGVYERAGFQVYPFFRMFDGLDIRRYGYHPDRTDSHFSDVGNDVIGQRLAEYVRGHFSFGTR